MIAAAEKLYGPYRWGRYDLLILPASFPYGGMENPRLTFATPTILAGDRSLVSLVAHELAHSWSGNLVTNATWNDFWLNEGFTTYFERRIMEAALRPPLRRHAGGARPPGPRRRDQGAGGIDKPDTRLAPRPHRPRSGRGIGRHRLREGGALPAHAGGLGRAREARPLPAHLLRHLRVPVDGLGPFRPVPEAEPAGRRRGGCEEAPDRRLGLQPRYPRERDAPSLRCLRRRGPGRPGFHRRHARRPAHHRRLDDAPLAPLPAQPPRGRRRAEDGRPRRDVPLSASRETPRSSTSGS